MLEKLVVEGGELSVAPFVVRMALLAFRHRDVRCPAVVADRHLDNVMLSEQTRRRVDIVQQTTEMSELRDMLSGKRQYAVVMIFGTVQKHQLRLLRQMVSGDDIHDYFIV